MLLHVYVFAPETVKLMVLPKQRDVVPLIETEGNALTVTVVEAEFSQPFMSVPVTV